MQVTAGGGDVAVAQQFLDGEEVYATFEQVGSKTVAQGVRATALHDAGTVARALVGALGRFDADALLSAAVAKEPSARTKDANKSAQML